MALAQIRSFHSLSTTSKTNSASMCNLGFLVYKTEVWENTIYVCLCVYEECMLEDWGSVAEHWPSKCVKSPIYDSQNKHTQRESGLGEDKERERMIDKGKTKYM